MSCENVRDRSDWNVMYIGDIIDFVGFTYKDGGDV